MIHQPSGGEFREPAATRSAAERIAPTRKDSAVEEPVDVSAMTPDELRELLQEEGSIVSDEQAALLMKLISELGGIENAQSALAQMISQQRAA
jgi:DNA-directed RNA polymerase subunit F